MATIRLLLAVKRQILRQGLSMVLQEYSELEIVHECTNGSGAIEKAVELRPDVVLIDTELRDCSAIEATSRIHELLPQTRITLFTHLEPKYDLLAALKAGATGCISEYDGVEEMFKAITLVAADELVISSPMATELIEDLKDMQGRAGDMPGPHLSKREQEVLTMVAKGATNRDISAALFITENTVKVHIRNIMEKLQLHRRSQVTIFALERDLAHKEQTGSTTDLASESKSSFSVRLEGKKEGDKS